jgi:tetratricopeptide (TPR) repeat protein
METLGRPDWQSVVYERLATRYGEQERWQDAAHTWSTFVAENPLSAAAPEAQQALIAVLEDGKFPSDAAREKERYVMLFGASSAWREAQDEAVLAGIDPTLKSHIDGLANSSHVAVQERSKKQAVASEDYLVAARWYETSLQTFPDGKDAPRQLLLLGDLYMQAGDTRRAVATWRKLVDEHGDAPESRDGMYALILGLRTLHDQGQNGEHELSLRMLVDAQIGFAMDHREDPRAATVQAAAANDLFTLQDYGQAMTLASNLLESWPAADVNLRSTGLTILGHSRFETADFAGAEAAYGELLPLLAADRRPPVAEKLLAAVYRQGEIAEQAGDLDGAIGHYLRLSAIDPNAEITVRGAFDAVALKEKAGDTEGAAQLLASLRARHADHALLKDANVRLASMYEQSGDPVAAAAEMKRIADSDSDTEVRRQSRYRAGELYLAANDPRSATREFERYVRDHAEPAATRIEAMQQLAQIEAAAGNQKARKGWLSQLVQAHERTPSARSPRTTTLAAQARYELALDDRIAFDQVALRAPLAASLKQKSERLQKAVGSFEAVVNYQVQDVATAATFQIADLYKALAAAIVSSQRPSGLSAEELDEYNLLLEEQAYPFEEKAIEIHELNSQRSWDGVYDQWVEKSFAELKRMLPGRFDKQEQEVSDVRDIH